MVYSVIIFFIVYTIIIIFFSSITLDDQEKSFAMNAQGSFWIKFPSLSLQSAKASILLNKTKSSFSCEGVDLVRDSYPRCAVEFVSNAKAFGMDSSKIKQNWEAAMMSLLCCPFSKSKWSKDCT